jgi:peptide/nickel transport system substrate-binding protein
MFSSKKLAIVVLFVMIAPLVLAACGPTPEPQVIIETVKETVVVQGEEKVVEKEVTKIVEQTVFEEKTVVETQVVEVTAVPEMVERSGAWVDTVVLVEEPNSDAAVTRLEAGDIDVFAYNISEPAVAQRVFDSTSLVYETSYGNFNDLTFMPSTNPTFNDGRLNPFYSDKIREAMNWLIDRSYITQEITGGLARPRFVPINYASKDSALLADVISAIELKYAHNPDLAVEVITAEMEALGAEMVDGKWNYNGEPVVLIGLIRVEDERLEIGDYVSNLLEDIGFTVTRDYKTSAEASPCWLRGDPDEGCAHFYTGGWVSTAISRDAGSNFSFYYTPDGLPFPPWQAYSPVPEFYDIATKLTNNDFATMEERRDLMAQALDYAMLDSQRIWLKDDVGVAPHAADITLASDLSGSIYGSWLWAQTIKRTGQVGGSLTIAMPSIMTEPWNAIAGTNWVYDMMPIRAIQDNAVVPDPFTGLTQPNRLSKSEVYVEEGLPVDIALDWVTLEFVPAGSIVVPDDAWSDWDAENQVFITASEYFTETPIAKSKVVMYYEDDFFDKMTWHDGSPFTIGDMVMFMILQFDRAKEASPYYDEAYVPEFQTFMSAFKGWKVASTDPLVIEYYTDAYGLDAENNVTNFRAAYPSAYSQGQASWHNLVPGLRAEAAGEAAFSPDKAEANEVEWLSYIAGPSMDIMKAQLDAAQEEGWLPFEPTMSQFVSADEVASRYANLQEWYRRYGHFYIGTGPLYLQKAFPVEGTLILQRYEAYPDSAEKWNKFATAPIPEVLVDGPDRVTIGEEAVYDIFVDFAGEPYPVADIFMVKYLVFDATGTLVEVGDATAVEDGYWQATLSADVTGALEAGSNQFAAIAVSNRALVPVRETLQFVTQ